MKIRRGSTSSPISREDFVGVGGILYSHLFEQSTFRIHSGFPQLLGVHLTKTLVTLGVKGFVGIVSASIFLDKL